MKALYYGVGTENVKWVDIELEENETNPTVIRIKRNGRLKNYIYCEWKNYWYDFRNWYDKIKDKRNIQDLIISWYGITVRTGRIERDKGIDIIVDVITRKSE